MKYGKIVFGAMLLCALFAVPTYATTYSHDTSVRFTFNSQLDVRIDTADIEILDLTPGTSSDSNIVGITISTNNVVGYTATASVGDATHTTTSMVHDNGTNSFTSLATGANLATLTTDNTWGYSTSTDGGTSWSNYSGLPIYTDTAKEIATTSVPTNDQLKFKINAKTSTSQAAGDYHNVINFSIVANVPPRTVEDAIEQTYANPPVDPETHNYTIQSLNENVCDLVEAIGESTLLTDVRDHTNYHVAKLADGRCWMQDNLALDLLDADTKASMTSSNTNATDTSIGHLINGGGDASDQYATAPVTKATSGWYISVPMVNSDIKDQTPPSDPEAIEGDWKNGVYYNICAASAGSYCYGDGASGGNPVDKPDTLIDIDQDVCPSNWRMPSGGPGGEYETLYNSYPGNTVAIRFALFRDDFRSPISGMVYEGSIRYSGSYGYTWSATKNINPSQYGFYYLDTEIPIDPSGYYERYVGMNVRCVSKESPSVTVNFNANTGSGSMPSMQVKMLRSMRLIQNEFTKEGYVFNGWNEDPNGLDNGYGDEDLYTANVSESTTAITLYAQWAEDTGGQGGGSGYQGRTLARAYEEAYLYNGGDYEGHRGMYVPERDTSGNYTGNYFEADDPSDYIGIPARDLRYAMQDANLLVEGQKICDRTTVVGSTVHLLDLRDNKSYWATKLKDGNCWMTQNLDLNLTAGVALTSQYTDLGWDKENNQYKASPVSWTPARTTINAENAPNGVISSWENSYDYDISVDVGNWYWDGGEDRKTSNDYLAGNDGGVFKKDQMFDQTQEHGHVGNYYNWIAATAHSQIGNVPPSDSICPKYWRLPYINTYEGGGPNVPGTRDFRDLIPLYARADGDWVVNGYQVSGNVAVRHPLYFVEAGYISTDKTILEAGYSGRYWTSGTNNNNYFPGNAWYLQFDFSRIDEWDHTYNMHYSVGYNGKSIRCMMR